MIDNAIKNLSENDKKILFIKLNYNISMNELCALLNLKERTAFRRVERAFEDMTEQLNQSKYAFKLEQIIAKEDWISKICENVKQRRLAYKDNPQEMLIN